MATPLLRALRSVPAFADAEVTVAGKRHLLPLLEGLTEVDQRLALGRARTVAGPFGDAGPLRQGGFDGALLLPNSFRAALTVRLARIPVRIGYNRDCRGRLLTHSVPLARGGRDVPVSAIEYYLDLVRALGGQVDDGDLAPRLCVTDTEAARAEAMLAAAGCRPDQIVVMLNPGASKVEKQWPPDRFAAVGRALIERHGSCVVINGGPGEQDLTRRVKHAMGPSVADAPVIDLAEQGCTLDALKALCARTRILITNDTGTRHIAVGVGGRPQARPPLIVTIFGTVAPEWSRTGYPHETELHDGRAGDVRSISIARVLAATDQLLEQAARIPASPRSDHAAFKMEPAT